MQKKKNFFFVYLNIIINKIIKLGTNNYFISLKYFLKLSFS